MTNSYDLATWVVNLYEGRVFSRSSLDEVLQTVSYETGEPAFSGYGLGVQTWESDWGLIYGHGGIFPGYQTQIEYIPQLKCGMALQVNADRFSGRLNQTLHELIGQFLPLVDAYLKTREQ